MSAPPVTLELSDPSAQRTIAMQQRPFPGASTLFAHSYQAGRQPLHRGAVLLATVLAVGVLGSVLYGLGPAGRARLRAGGAPGSSGATSGKAAEDEKDDPTQVDTIVLGDPADAPVPARRGEHVSAVHATILVHLPRFGEQVGLIPDSTAGRLLYGWLAAFNKASSPALGDALPTLLPEAAAAMQMGLREETGGFNLLSAKEVQPGVLVFRLRAQNPPETEVLGTLQVRAESNPAAIGSFSLRAIASPHLESDPVVGKVRD